MGSTTRVYRSDDDDDDNYAYTDMPLRLIMADMALLLANSWALPHILLPLRGRSGAFAELYPTAANLWSLLMQVVLGVGQVGFFVALPWTVLLPVWAAGLVVGGEHWTKSNLNRLALTFGRPIMGIHNRTSGILFDIVECLVQRNLTYATGDIRLTYRLLRSVLYDPTKTRVVFILHSQGGIEGGLVIDWLLQDTPQDLLSKLEVYTFGNAANHFNNPRRRASWRAAEDRAIGHIEHYAHSTDFVARCGVLSRRRGRFHGRLFNRSTGRGGHLLNQHYLDGMFPLRRDEETGEFVGADEGNGFMDELVDGGDGRMVRVGELSRLWAYRNGQCPAERENGVCG
ncbi:hypothetical protein CDD80_7543 [Ophiocordyceps camponoti-rufipedis]|uniref:DUF676 domain-containing protein n=1 Tax=Ophiocordyceps camponoti-rufipedis TaxID=2004952 RepID=A0A2C5ZE27_9HYPO|nr:hypothetical protein CDD80_7543 [Ophiocordyceps camponoti-rufipedis]